MKRVNTGGHAPGEETTMSPPVTQDDVDSVKDVPIEDAMNYLETLERERRGLLKVGTILRAVQKTRNVQEAAELQRTQAEQRATAR